jgi:hypothetical protein
MALPDPYTIDWNVTLEGRGWTSNALERYELTPEKIEMMDGRLFGTEEDRLRMLGLLLENCGAETAVRYGDPEVWRRAVALLDDAFSKFSFEVRATVRQWDAIETQEGARAYYRQWALPDYVERREGQQRDIEAIVASYPEAPDRGFTSGASWSHSEIQSAAIDGGEGIIGVKRVVTEYHAQGSGPGPRRLTQMQTVEIWQMRWRETDGQCRLAEAECLASVRSDG